MRNPSRLKTARRTQISLRSAASVQHLRAISVNIKYAQLANRPSIVPLIARNTTGRSNTRVNAKSFKQKQSRSCE
jgi:hypothetical protein